ncbi:molybdopterin molybdotransferase MoeA [Compostibacter hankyongensis]|uniref:Molybdopterin molybdenumtransferase n=1 Tax=Compostibacter hankyongensis TaxID=1007089 RepID=A0ABP8FLM9_9BACT
MITVTQALSLVLENRIFPDTETVDLAEAGGRVLAAPVLADRDFPPYHRVTMDGIALRAAALEKTRSFPIENIQAAGMPASRLSNPLHCIEVMTGAVLPGNTDTVIPYEQCDRTAGVAVLKAGAAVSPFQYIHQQGTDAGRGDVLLEKDRKITSAMVGVMASAGMTRVSVYRLPAVAVCSTGDELIPPGAQPAPHQIRASNSRMLAAALQTEGIRAELFHLSDNKTEMKASLASLLENFQVILFSGAVSKGRYDHLPALLQEAGVKKIFHGVAQKPGKPFFFGTLGDRCHLFGFPGNPVSTYTCYQLFFKPWLYRSLHCSSEKQVARLAEEFIFKPDLTCHLLVNLSHEQGMLTARPCRNSGSGDLTALARGDALMSLPAERSSFHAGEFFEVTML